MMPKRALAAVTRRTSATKFGRTVFTPGSGNVLADLGLPHTTDRLAKAELSRVIVQIAKEHRWTQKRAAGVIGIVASDMSDLLRGKLRRFSQERLERFLNALDMDVRIQVGPRWAGKKLATMFVERVAGF